MNFRKYYLLFIVLNISFLFTTNLFINQSQAADMEFDIIYKLAEVVNNSDGTKTYTINFDIKNMTGETVSNLTITMLSPILLSSDTNDSFFVGAVVVEENISTSGSFTVENLGLNDDEFMMHLVWLLEYDDASGVHQIKYVEGFYELFSIIP